MSKELVRSGLVELAAEPEKILEHYKKFQDFKKKVLDKNDMISINNKPFIKRSGWQKIALAFNISTSITKEERYNDPAGKYFVYKIWVEAKAPNGRTAIGDGACASNERAFAHLEHDVYATAVTRATNRSLSNVVGSGEISAEEMDSRHIEIPKQTDEAYCACTIPKPDAKGVCGFCNKLTKKAASELRARLQ